MYKTRQGVYDSDIIYYNHRWTIIVVVPILKCDISDFYFTQSLWHTHVLYFFLSSFFCSFLYYFRIYFRDSWVSLNIIKNVPLQKKIYCFCLFYDNNHVCLKCLLRRVQGKWNENMDIFTPDCTQPIWRGFFRAVRWNLRRSLWKLKMILFN